VSGYQNLNILLVTNTTQNGPEQFMLLTKY